METWLHRAVMNNTRATIYYINDSESNSNDTLMLDEEADLIPVTQEIINFLNLYYLGFIIVLGFLGHGANVIVFTRRRKKLSSPSYYLTALSVVDLVFLVTVFFLWLTHFDVELFFQPGVYQGLFYLSSTSSCISAWLVAAFTFERLIVVRYPLKRTKICTVRRAKVIIASLIVMAAIIQLVSFFPTGKRGVGVTSVDSSSSTTTSSVENSRKTADRVVPFHYEMVRIFSMLETVVTLVIPPVAIVIMNGVIIHGLTRHQLNQSFITGRNKHAPSLKNKTQLRHSRRVNIQMKTMVKASAGMKQQTHSPADDVRPVADNNDENKSNDHQQDVRGCEHQHSSPSNAAAFSSYCRITITTAAVVESSHDDQCLTSPTTNNDELIQADLVLGKSSITSAFIPEINDGPQDKDDNDLSKVGRLGDEQLTEKINNRITHHQTFLNLDAIETDTDTATVLSPSLMRNNVQVQNTDSMLRSIDRLTEKQQPSLLVRRNGIKIKRTGASNRTEYNVTKKLVLVSAMHILLNLPSYAINLKNFIDETPSVRSNNNIETSWTIIYLHQFAMVLYYTSFSINSLLYPNYSRRAVLTYLKRFKCSFFCKKPSQIMITTDEL